jgi:O-antigen/teichoic acid export membrane protein
VKKVVKKSLEVAAFLVFGITALLYLNSEPLIILLFGKKWFVSVGYFKVLAFAAYGFPVSVILVNVLIGLGKSGAFLKLEIIKKIIGLSGMATGFVWGIYGFLWANVLVTFIGVTLNMRIVDKLINFPVLKQWKVLLKYMSPALIISFIIWFLNLYLPDNLWLLLAINTILFSILYFLCNFAVKTNGFLYIKDVIISKWKKSKNK